MQVALCSDWYRASAVARKQRHQEATIKMAALGRVCVEASSHFIFSLKIMKLLHGN
jgi:hypothetical protein